MSGEQVCSCPDTSRCHLSGMPGCRHDKEVQGMRSAASLQQQAAIPSGDSSNKQQGGQSKDQIRSNN